MLNLFKVDGDGSCFFRAVYEQLGFEDTIGTFDIPQNSKHAKMYTPFRLKMSVLIGIAGLALQVLVALCVLYLF